MDPAPAVSLLDLPRPFLSQLLNELDDFEAAQSLISVSRSAFQLVFELKPAALVLWGSTPATARRLQQLLPLGGLRALLLPDSDENVDLPRHLQLPGLKTAVLNYRFPALNRLVTSAHASTLDSIIIRGWQLQGEYTPRLSTFLQQLQELSSVQHLVLTLPCIGAAAAALGKLQHLRSLRMCTDVSHDSEAKLRQDADTTWTADTWLAAIQPLSLLTSLQLKLPLVLRSEDDLQLESLSQLRRLDVQLDKPLAIGAGLAGSFSGAAGGNQTASLLLQQPGLPSLQHMTRLVLATTWRQSYAFAFDDADEDAHRRPPDDAMEVLAQLTNLHSLHITPQEWIFSLQQLQPLSACCKLTELVVNQLALGFASSEQSIDVNGSRLSNEEKAIVTAAMAAAAQQQQQQQQQWQGGASGRGSVVNTPEQMQGLEGQQATSPVATSAAAAAAAVGSAPISPAAAAAGHAGCSSSTSPSSGTPKNITINGRQVQVPLLPQLKVVRCTSLYWRLPLSVLSVKLEEVAYKRLTSSDYGSFVMTDVQTFDGPPLPVFDPPHGFEIGDEDLPAGALFPGMGPAGLPVFQVHFGPQQQHMEQQQQQQHGEQQQQHGEQQQQQQQQQQQHEGEGEEALDVDMIGDGGEGRFADVDMEGDLGPPAGAQFQPQQQQQQHVEGEAGPVLPMYYAAAAATDSLSDSDNDGPPSLGSSSSVLDHAVHAAPPPELLTGSEDEPLSDANDGMGDGMAGFMPGGGNLNPPAAAAAAAAVPVALGDAPADKIYADVLRGLRGLRKLDIDVTGLCKVVRLTSSPLAGVQELRLHMLGAVQLPRGGLPTLPSLTHLEFYLPDERNWEADYNDDEDLALWQHQSNVRQLVIRGTFHAGGFFAPGHLDLAHRAMPHITRLVFMKCRDLKPERLQKVVDSKLSPYIELVEGSNFGPREGDTGPQQQQQQQQVGASGAAAVAAAAGGGGDGGAGASSSSMVVDVPAAAAAAATAAAHGSTADGGTGSSSELAAPHHQLDSPAQQLGFNVPPGFLEQVNVDDVQAMEQQVLGGVYEAVSAANLAAAESAEAAAVAAEAEVAATHAQAEAIAAAIAAATGASAEALLAGAMGDAPMPVIPQQQQQQQNANALQAVADAAAAAELATAQAAAQAAAADSAGLQQGDQGHDVDMPGVDAAAAAPTAAAAGQPPAAAAGPPPPPAAATAPGDEVDLPGVDAAAPAAAGPPPPAAAAPGPEVDMPGVDEDDVDLEHHGAQLLEMLGVAQGVAADDAADLSFWLPSPDDWAAIEDDPLHAEWAASVAQETKRRVDAVRTAAKLARSKRQQGLRAVMAAAAEQGVVVKLLPVVEWQKWYHELLD